MSFSLLVNVEINVYELRDVSVYASYTDGEEKTTQSEFSFKLYFFTRCTFLFTYYTASKIAPTPALSAALTTPPNIAVATVELAIAVPTVAAVAATAAPAVEAAPAIAAPI